MVSRTALPLLPLFTLLALAPAQLTVSTRANAQALEFASQNSIVDALRAKVQSFVSPADQPGARDALIAFYEVRGYTPLWVDTRGPTRAAQRLLSEFAKAGDYGLDSKSLMPVANAIARPSGTWSAVETADAEVEISTLALSYAHQARGGRISAPEELLSSYLDRRPDLPEPAAVLAAVSTSSEPDAVLRSYHPQHEQFRLLQAAYSKLRHDTPQASPVTLPANGPLLRSGLRHDDVVALRVRLGLPVNDVDADLYDASVVAAVKQFQKYAGLSADGLVGKRTRRALSGDSVTSDKDQIDKLRANLEAWRWMPGSLGSEYLFVNIPAFTVSVVKNGEVRLAERVITGTSDKQTPIFSKKLSTIVLRPQWHLPNSIKIEKLLSAQRRGRRLEDLGYVIKKGRRTVKSWEVNWAKANLSHYEISQPSGDGNALGDVKFLFPNKHSVYLHDTPSKSLFGASERTFSHGCIRVRNPLTLAQTLLDDDKGAGAFNVKRLVQRGPGSNRIDLDVPMPIHIAYFTAWADEAGNVTYYKDVYGHEKRINLALAGKWKAIDKGRDHLAAVNTDQLKAIRVIQKVGGNPLDAAFNPPMGVTSGPSSLFKPTKSYSNKRNRNSVGDIMRNALGGF